MSAPLAEPQPVFTSFAEAPRVAAGDVQVATLLAPAETGGRSDVREIRCEPGGRIESFGDPATHRYLYVLAGDWTITVGEECRPCAAETTVVAPQGAPCSGAVTGSDAGRILVLAFPR